MHDRESQQNISNGEQRNFAMRYFSINSPFSVTLFFTLSFLTLALSLNTTQIEVMKNIHDNLGLQYNGHPCQWDGVSCSKNGVDDVVGLKFSFSYMNNSIWQYVCKLPALQLLDFSNNYLKGPISECVGSFVNLTILRLSFNLLSESIPPQLFSMKNLQTLDLTHNQLTGPIPPQLSSLNNLQTLYLSHNQLTGYIPLQLFSLSNLEDLDLSFNHLSGKIPSAISNARNLTYLAMNDNFLNGPIPKQLGSCTQLKELRLDRNKLIGNLPLIGELFMWGGDLNLSHNSLTGKIPITLSNLSFIASLDLSDNRLTGEIPEGIGDMSELYWLDLSNNKLTGQIPKALGYRSDLDCLDLSNNKLTGQIPVALGNMSELHRLDLSNNKLTGQIPEALGNMIELHRLDLSNNKLTGQIPETLGNMSELHTLDLSNNKLTGQIPEALGNMSELYWLDLSNNKLTGQIPEALGLYCLNLSNNKLTGKIPTSVQQISYLDLSNNELEEDAPTGKSHSTVLIKVLGAAAVVAIFIICFLVFRVLWIRNLHNRAEFKQTFCKILQKVEHPRISHEELLAATNRFHNSNLLSTNSFGSVYKGFLADGTCVAVKVLNLMHEQSHKIFRAECKVLQKARHRNLARITTTCSTIHIKALIFEYFSNGSLEKHLYQSSCRMGLRKLLNIAIDIAHAVEYLHYDCLVQIVHCDIKPSNVLLDESMTAHLSDFGISRLMGRIVANPVTSKIDFKGSVGYIAPEYGLNGMMSPRGDVFSYGILLLELLTRRRPTDNMFDGDLSLHNWVKRAFPERVAEVVDKSLLMEGAGKETEECLISLMRLGLLCSSDSPEARPTMRDVSNLLKSIQQDFTADTSCSIN